MDKLTCMRTLVAVVKEGSFVGAAAHLDMSPQLVSKYIAALEEKVRTRLLNRTTRQLKLTEAGAEYVERCKQVLEDIEEMEDALNQHHHNVAGELFIGAPMSFANQHMPQLLADFQQRFPDIQLRLQLSDYKNDFVESGYDVALRIGELQDSRLIAKRITQINSVFFASPEYLAQHGMPLTPADLSHHRYLKYSNSMESRVFGNFDRQLSELNMTTSLNVNNGEFILNSAIAGGGIGIQPAFIVGEALKQGKVVKILAGYEPNPIGLYLIYANKQFLPKKVRCFIDFVSGYYGSHPHWDDGC